MQVFVSLLLFLTAGYANAGTYGTENWGEMYWGDNPVTVPTEVPTITSATATEDQITIMLDDFPSGTGADGWSAVTSFIVTCGETSIGTSDTIVTISGLDEDTEYACSISASNAQGEGPEIIKVVTTATALKGINFLLICSAIECGRTES